MTFVPSRSCGCYWSSGCYSYWSSRAENASPESLCPVRRSRNENHYYDYILTRSIQLNAIGSRFKEIIIIMIIIMIRWC